MLLVILVAMIFYQLSEMTGLTHGKPATRSGPSPNDNGATFQGAEQETQRLKGPPT